MIYPHYYFTFSGIQIHTFSFASNQNNTTTPNMTSSIITDDGLDKYINEKNIGNMSQITNRSLSDATLLISINDDYDQYLVDNILIVGLIRGDVIQG
jgi:hypothetical protein